MYAYIGAVILALASGLLEKERNGSMVVAAAL
jgi:hypothetical protein